MASRAPRVLLCLCGCTAKLYAGGQRWNVRLAAIQTVEMACYAWLGAQVMLFFARHASLRGQSKTLRSHLSTRSFRIILCDAPTTRPDYTFSARFADRIRAGAVLQPPK